MNEKEFATIKEMWAETRELDADIRIDRLISAIEERDAIIHDLLTDQEAAYKVGMSDMLNACLDTIRRVRGEYLREDHPMPHRDMIGATHLGRIQATNAMIDALLQIGGLRSGQSASRIPPSAARDEVDNLRQSLRRINDLSLVCGVDTDTLQSFAEKVRHLAEKALYEPMRGFSLKVKS